MTEANLYLLMVLLGQVVPPLTDLINKHVPSAKVRLLSSFLVSLIISILVNFERLKFGSTEEMLLSAIILFGSGTAAYKLWYEGTTYQNDIRFSTNNLPLKELIPPVELLAPKLQSIKSSLVSKM